MKRSVFFLIFLIGCTFFIYSDKNTDSSSTEAMQCNCPFFLSLFLSHGSGLYAIKQQQKAFPYLLAHIFLIDIPALILIGGIIHYKIQPEFYQGTNLTIAEYVSNSLLLIVIGAIPVIRFLECRAVLKARNRKM